MKCPYEGCTANRLFPNPGWFSTSMGFQEYVDAKTGHHHFHNPNSSWREWSCSSGHRWVEVAGNKCSAPGCNFGSEPKINKCK